MTEPRESRNGVSIPWPTAWIEEAIAIIKDSGSQTPHTERKRQKRINALLSAVPCPPTDLGFNSPADRLAQRLQAAVSEIATPLEHDYHDREDGLRHCKVCGGGESSLTQECPGLRMPYDIEQAVMTGHLDFLDGQWRVK